MEEIETTASHHSLHHHDNTGKDSFLVSTRSKMSCALAFSLHTLKTSATISEARKYHGFCEHRHFSKFSRCTTRPWKCQTPKTCFLSQLRGWCSTTLTPIDSVGTYRFRRIPCPSVEGTRGDCSEKRFGPTYNRTR